MLYVCVCVCVSVCVHSNVNNVSFVSEERTYLFHVRTQPPIAAAIHPKTQNDFVISSFHFGYVPWPF